MMSTLQYDSRKRPTASQLLRHSFFKNHTISKDVYTFAAGKKLKKLNSNKASETESLKIGPNGITIDSENVDNSPFSLDKYKETTGLRSGFKLRKRADIHEPMVVRKPTVKEIHPRNIRKKKMQDLGLVKQSVLFQKDNEYNPSYYRSDEPKEDINDFKTRIKEPIFPYYKNETNVLSNLKIPSLNPEDRKIYKPRMKEITEERQYEKYNKNYNLANPALVTSDQKHAKKSEKKYELDFTHKRKSEEQEVYKPSDPFAKRVLNVQQSLPELKFKQNFSNEISR